MAVGNEGIGRIHPHIPGRSILAASLIAGICVSSVALLPARAAGAATASVSNCFGSASVAGSLPYQVANASSGDTINFSVTCPTSSPITLATSLNITKNVTIQGPGDGSVVVDGENLHGFDMPGATLVISGLTLTRIVDIYSDQGGSLTIANSHLTHMGGINVAGGTTNISGSTITDSSSPYGGAVLAYYGTVNVTNSTLSRNSAGYVGGAIDNNGGVVNITGSTLSGNTGNVAGGIANTYGGTVHISNSTLVGNTSQTQGGGAVFSNGGTVTVTNSTIADNSSAAGSNSSNLGGGSIFTSGGTVTVEASILANNTSGGECSGSVTDSGYNLADDTSCGFTQSTSVSGTPSGLDPTGLQNNGGPTQTVALEPASPAIGAVTNALLCSTPDQRGVARPIPCDIGAYQNQEVSQSISFTSTPPAVAAIGGPTYIVSAAASSGLPVSFTIDSSAASVCSISGVVVSFTGVGACIVDANQPGSPNSNAAPLVQQSITVKVLAITTTALPNGKANNAYSMTLAAIGGNPPFLWKLITGSLPKGIKLNKSTGLISGKTKEIGTITFTVEALDAKIKVKHHSPTQNTATAQLSITIAP